MARRTHLRSRVLLLTGAFSIVLFAMTFALSWVANAWQEEWSRQVTERKAAATLERIALQQHWFMSKLAASPDDAASYRIVRQLLEDESLRAIDRPMATSRGSKRVLDDLRARIANFDKALAHREIDLQAASDLVVEEARRLAAERDEPLDRSTTRFARRSKMMMMGGLAIAWVIVILSFAGVQTMMRKVVRPLEALAGAAADIAAGRLDTRVPLAGDEEIFVLGDAVRKMNAKLRDYARTDELTGLPNFRAFREKIDAEIERTSRYPAAVGILVLDLDHFKRYNDTFGHAAGNDALQRVAAAIRDSVRTPDFAARYGGEEFAVILPEIDVPALGTVAERVRFAIQSLPAPPDGDLVTVSIGAAMFPLDGKSAEELFHVADERLYEAKRAGRNRVAGPAETSVATA